MIAAETTDSKAYTVAGHEADLHNYHPRNFFFGEARFAVHLEFVDTRTYNVVATRTDAPDDAPDLSVMILCMDRPARVVNIKAGTGRARVETDYTIARGRPVRARPPPRPFPPARGFAKLSRDDFNTKFDAGVVTLPSSLYAVGVGADGTQYMYNEKYDQYYNVSYVAQFVLRVREYYNTPASFYFVISSCDGYGEGTYCTARTEPYFVGEDECKGLYNFVGYADHQYPVYHRRRYIVAQSSHVNMPYVINTVDRHYLYHNLYNSFRSFHRGLAFADKTPKLVFAGQSSRGGLHNFLDSRHIKMNPRDFFTQHIAPLYNFIECSGGWMDREDQIHYKYVLDIDGNASTYDATAWKLNCGSVIFKPRSGWTQWFYDEYCAPGRYFIEIKDDFSDVAEKFAWCQAHPAECEAMVRRCRALFQRVYAFDAVVERVAEAIYTVSMS
jgi:hypothetical protein